MVEHNAYVNMLFCCVEGFHYFLLAWYTSTGQLY